MIKQVANFYPGPARVDSNLAEYYCDACNEGIVSINHRSAAFADMMVKLKQKLYEKLDIPASYEVVFTSSATECWEIIAQSLVDPRSHHFFNGAFGEKWYEYTKKIKPEASFTTFGLNDGLPIEADVPQDATVICVTQNETSNGTQVAMNLLHSIREKYADRLIAVDATSSMAGIPMDFLLADVWYASVQKCFGLPAGLAVMILSPKAIAKANAIGVNRYYNSLLFMLDNFKINQAPYTPNVVSLYLLYRVLEKRIPILEQGKVLAERCKLWYQLLSKLQGLNLLVTNEEVQSQTVLALEGAPDFIEKVKIETATNGIIVGNGYGKWKQHTIRIANFPAITENEIAVCHDFFIKNYSRVSI